MTMYWIFAPPRPISKFAGDAGTHSSGGYHGGAAACATGAVTTRPQTMTTSTASARIPRTVLHDGEPTLVREAVERECTLAGRSAPAGGFEPPTKGLTVPCATVALRRNRPQW